MNIWKDTKSRKAPTSSTETESQNETQKVVNDTTTDSATKTRVASRKSLLNKTQ